MQQIIINRCFGGYGLSTEAIRRWAELKQIPHWVEDDNEWGGTVYTGDPADRMFIGHWDIERNDPVLIQVVQELGPQANGQFSDLKVVEIPDDVKWLIVDYDGIEHIAEQHRTWS